MDFGEVVTSSVDSKTDWNMIALCRAQLGEPIAAENAYRQALLIDASFKARINDETSTIIFMITRTERMMYVSKLWNIQYIYIYITKY